MSFFLSCARHLVVDCHRDWCGPCETLHPTFTRISLETTESEERCLFVAVRYTASLINDHPESNCQSIRSAHRTEGAATEHNSCKALLLFISCPPRLPFPPLPSYRSEKLHLNHHGLLAQPQRSSLISPSLSFIIAGRRDLAG